MMISADGLRYECGSEHAPDDPFGRERIELDARGTLTYERRGRWGHASIEGRVDPSRFAPLIEALGATGFPAPPQASFAPGASVVRITALPSGAWVDVDPYDAADRPGYGDVVRDLGQLAEGLRDARAEILAAWGFAPSGD